MGRKVLSMPNVWEKYSQKLINAIENPRCAGYFSEDNAQERGMFLAEGYAEDRESGQALKIYWLVDNEDAKIADTKFQAFGSSALIGVSEAACQLVIGKTYLQAQKVSVDLIDIHLRDRHGEPSFSEESLGVVRIVLGAMADAAEKCSDIPIPEKAVAVLTESSGGNTKSVYPGWLELSTEEKLVVINDIFDEELRPYVQLDGGDVEVVELKDDREVIISYKGACATCLYSTGATLSYIQQMLKTRIHPDLEVTPRF